MPTYTFTFRAINGGDLREYNDKDWEIKPEDDYRERERKEEKYKDDENQRYYRIFKIEPVKKNNKNYVFVAFPWFTNDHPWGPAAPNFSYNPIFCNNPQRINVVEDFAGKVRANKLEAKDVPYFRVSSPVPFSEKSVRETYYMTPDGQFSERKCGILRGLADGVAEDDLILIAPVEGYQITQVEEEEGNKKPDKSNHKCQEVHDKLHDWEIKAKNKILQDCQNDNHAGYYEGGVFAAPEYAQYTTLTKKCACGGQLKGNSYGDEMSKCRSDCSEVEEEEEKTDNSQPDESTVSEEPETKEPEKKVLPTQEENKGNSNGNQTITQLRNSTKQTIIKLLKDNGLKKTDLGSKFANWETDLEKCDTEAKIKEFQQQIEQAIQEYKKANSRILEKNKDNSLSLPIKLLIGGGITIIVLGIAGVIWFKKQKKKR